MASEGLAGLDRLVALAEPLAAAWAARGRVSTTLGIERAILRLFGVSGLDRDDRPLAASVVNTYAGRQPDRLAMGLALPFAMSTVELDLEPQALAERIAVGYVDLALDAELLTVPSRRAEAEAAARSLAAGALARIDSNRTARDELLAVFGDPRRPWAGLAVSEATAGEAAGEARDAAQARADVVRITVPAGRELIDRLQDAGLEAPVWRPGEAAGALAAESAADAVTGGLRARADGDPARAPAGSQRGLRLIRATLDEDAAGRRDYVRLATRAPALAAPEQAAVAALERVDVVEADAMAEIVLAGVDPDRAIADHAFAHRLLRRAGAVVIVGPGPLVVAPDLEHGQPASTATRSGRALALQLLGVLLARADGTTPASLLIGALPGFIGAEADAAPMTVAEVVLRRALYPEHDLVLDESWLEGGVDRGAWRYLAALAMSVGGTTADRAGTGRTGAVDAGGGRTGVGLVLRGPSRQDAAAVIADARAAAEVATGARAAFAYGSLAGPALAHAEAAIQAGIATLEAITNDGWRSVLGEPGGGRGGERLGADAVLERSEPFDPLELV